MATQTTEEPALVLTPPDPVPSVAPAKAAGLVPVDDTKRTELQRRVDDFIDQLVAQDANSPEFGKRVDAISNLGAREIREAAGQSNRFLDRPVKAMDQESGVGADNYPPSAIRAEEQGRVVAKLTVGTDGRVTDCTVTTSSNSSALDQATCRIAKSRVRFTPAIDATGNPVTSSYTLPVRWVLPQN